MWLFWLQSKLFNQRLSPVNPNIQKPKDQMDCIQHNKPFLYYCKECKKHYCERCIKQDENHNDKHFHLSQDIPIQKYKERLQKLYDYVNIELSSITQKYINNICYVMLCFPINITINILYNIMQSPLVFDPRNQPLCLRCYHSSP